MKIKQIASFICISFLLTSCWDKVELESRGFVVAIGVDKAGAVSKVVDKINDSQEEDEPLNFNKKQKLNGGKKDRSDDAYKDKKYNDENRERKVDDGETKEDKIEVTMILPKLAKGATDSDKVVKISGGETFTKAISRADSYSSKKSYFGHTKVCLLGSELLESEELLRSTLDGLIRNRELSRMTLLMAVDGKSSDILEFDTNGEGGVGNFISNFYSNNKLSVTMPYKIEDLTFELDENGSAIIPRISLEDDELTLSGAAILKDYSLKNFITGEEVQNLMWLKGNGVGAEISGLHKDTLLTMNVTENSAKLFFTEENGKLVCTVKSKVEGVITEFSRGEETLFDKDNIEKIENEMAEEINEDMISITKKFQDEYEMDFIGILKKLKNQNYDLYLKYSNDWNENFKNVQFIFETEVTIRNSGAIK